MSDNNIMKALLIAIPSIWIGSLATSYYVKRNPEWLAVQYTKIPLKVLKCSYDDARKVLDKYFNDEE